MAKPAIALYLGETYATAGLFDISQPASLKLRFEKSVFLPQVSLKNLLGQMKLKISEEFESSENPVRVFIVTKYFDRLKQFRLGGSISQVIMKGFENSYSLKDSKALSLAAAQLIISIEPGVIENAILESELDRIKKINPDLNKVVISLPEDKFTANQIEEVVSFFEKAGLNIFQCRQSYNQNDLRKTLLNAGCEGTKEEINKDIHEAFGENSEIYFFCHSGFENQFENAELFNSVNNFFAHYLKKNKISNCAYFDIESFKFLRNSLSSSWPSPWGAIPINYYEHTELDVHPFAELKLNHLSMLNFDKTNAQLEPGPVLAGRAIKPLVLDLFWDELQENELCKSIFTNLSQDILKSKITNLFTVLEKGQKNNSLYSSIDDLKKFIKSSLIDEINLLSPLTKVGVIGPLSPLFETTITKKKLPAYSWPKEIISMVPESLL